MCVGWVWIYRHTVLRPRGAPVNRDFFYCIESLPFRNAMTFQEQLMSYVKKSHAYVDPVLCQ